MSIHGSGAQHEDLQFDTQAVIDTDICMARMAPTITESCPLPCIQTQWCFQVLSV